jgi:hypothetical protein
MNFSEQGPDEKLKLGKVIGKIAKVLPIASSIVPALAPINRIVQSGVQVAGVIKR